MTYKQFSIQLPVPISLKAPVLTDALGVPRYWVTVWALINARDLAESTEMKQLRYIEALYRFCDGLHGDGYLDDTLGACQIKDLSNLLEAYFVFLKNRPEITQAAETQWKTGLSFVKDVVFRISRNGNSMNQLAETESRLLHLDALYGQLHIRKTKHPTILRSLPAAVVSHLYDMLDPESSTNPFSRKRTRWTAFLAFILMLHQGLRRGEALLLPVNAVESGYDERSQKKRFWINVQVNKKLVSQDHRSKRPSIKTADSVRQIPVTELTANLIQTYVENYRGKPDHPFLLNTQWNTPLSHESITAYFVKTTSNLPVSVVKTLEDRTGKTSIEPHDLRHTCAVVRLNQLLSKNVPMDEALQQLRTFLGWTRTSNMPQRYARAVFEDRLSDVWAKVMDERIEILKSIPLGHA
ncbi:MAG: site-specific integrase [Acidithiobacillus sp.]|jgi:integrase|nr:site-specific integrase [Acidithiobacillus sp.]